MADLFTLSAPDLAALLCSRVCHDIISPVGAINNGLELLDEGGADEDAMNLIRISARNASARLQFARIAFGAAGSAGMLIDTGDAESVATAFLKNEKPELVWNGKRALLPKNKVKLLLNLIACSVTALPKGGEIDVAFGGSFETPSFLLRCKGNGARPPQYLTDFVAGNAPNLDAMSIQAYYTYRIAQTAHMRLEILKDGSDILLVAKPQA